MKVSMVLAGVLIAASMSTSAQSLTFCRSMLSEAERLACYDNLADSMLTADEQREPNDRPTTAVAKSPQDLTVLSSRPVTVTENFGLKQPRPEVDVEDKSFSDAITAIEMSSHRKWVITLANKQVWQQLDSERLSLKTGEQVDIRQASLGSYLLQKSTGSRQIRVKRIL